MLRGSSPPSAAQFRCSRIDLSHQAIAARVRHALSPVLLALSGPSDGLDLVLTGRIRCNPRFPACRRQGVLFFPMLPSADDEYTPAQRQMIDAQLKQAAKDHYYGPF